jgi:hypothetical protein
MNLPHEPIITYIILLIISNGVSTPLDPPNTQKKRERIIRRNHLSKPFHNIYVPKPMSIY